MVLKSNPQINLLNFKPNTKWNELAKESGESSLIKYDFQSKMGNKLWEKYASMTHIVAGASICTLDVDARTTNDEIVSEIWVVYLSNSEEKC